MDVKNKDLNFSEFQARERALATGKKYLNIFHQLHVIKAGIEVLNRDFLSLSDDVLEILPELAGGAKFYQHIKNLKDGITPINKIDADLLPFGAEVFETSELFHLYTDLDNQSYSSNKRQVPPQPQQPIVSQPIKTEPSIPMQSSIEEDEARLFELLRSFEATPKFLDAFKSDETIRDLGPDWKNSIKNLLDASQVQDKDLLKKNFENLCVFDIALNIWQECLSLLKNPKQKSKDEIKSNLENYKKYLNMFGAGGQDLYKKVEALIQ